ncbi:calcium-transporting atpase 12 [Quercus suber]|uniref:Calcium-transporting atpase 12 n=2 Tax=Quercus suber TaxID=58331 RepID=A0AAW0L662_QUESU
MVKEKDLDSIRKFGRTQIMEMALGIDSEKGILGHEQVLHSQRILSAIQTSALGFFQFLLKSCCNYTILLLFVSAVLSLGFGLKEEGPSTGWYEGVIIILAIIVLVVVDTLREFQLDHSHLMWGKHKLWGRQRMMVDVFIRGGFQKVNINDVLIGDIIRLKKDYTVPADGLFIAGETLRVDDDDAQINEENPFLFCGAKAIEGNGLMIVSSVGMDTRLGALIKQATHVPDKTPLPRQLDKVNKGTEIFGLSISILIIVVLFIRFMLLKEDADSNLPELKGKPNTMKEIMDAIEKIVVKPNGKISSLATSLSMLLVGVMEGIPFVITLAISFWNKKILSDRAIAQEPFACLTMSSVTSICIDTTGWHSSKLETIGREIIYLINFGFNVILVSEDNLSVLKDIALGCKLPDSLELKGEDFRNYTDKEKMSIVGKQIVLMGDSTPSDRLSLVQYLKDKDLKVAMVGIKTNAIPALKEVNVGITMSTLSTERARASSDIIIIRDTNFSFLIDIVRFGRCTFENIQKYIQLELTMSIAGLLITSITTMFCGYSPITSFQFLWANFVVALLGGLGLLTDPPANEQMRTLPLTMQGPRKAEQPEPLITKAMCRNIVSQALYQVAMLVTFQFKGQTIPGISNEVSKTLIFNSFVMCQVFNQVNAREVEKKNVFKSIHQNPLFGVAVGLNLVLQVAFIEIAHILAGNARLNWVQWFICLLLGMVSWVCDWVTKCTIKINRNEMRTFVS